MREHPAAHGLHGRRWPTTGLTVRGPDRLSGVDIDLHDESELTPTVAALAALADGPSRIRGVAHIRGHETDRLAALAARDQPRSAATREETEDGLVIDPKPLHGGVVAGLRRPPDGDRGRDHRPGRARASRSTTSAAPPRRFRTSQGCGARMLTGPLTVTQARDWRKLDESDVRVRPGKGTRPRSKRRPEHADAVTAMVDRRRPRTVDVRAGRRLRRVLVVAMRARELGRTPVVVGDHVGLVGDTSGQPDTLARIVRVDRAHAACCAAPRTTPTRSSGWWSPTPSSW